MVIRGGENVYPREIEELLYLHPDIVDAAVIGVPDARYGEELMAFLRIKPGADAPTTESIRAFCNGKIAHYKVPRNVEVVDEFPMTVTGKCRKVELREQARLQLEPGASVLGSRSPTAQRISSSGPYQMGRSRGELQYYAAG